MHKSAVIVDSRNVYGQVTALTGLRARPTVEGVRSALSRLGYDVGPVHVGLALPRTRDAGALKNQGRTNSAYKAAIEASTDADVLLGELHLKQSRGDVRVEEKMVDGACNVRITRYVEEIRRGNSPVSSVVVMSKDIDLTPSVQYGKDVGVPVIVAATDVVQHRDHPYLLLPPAVLPELVGKTGAGHDARNTVATLAVSSAASSWTVQQVGGERGLCDLTGLRAVPGPTLHLPNLGSTQALHVIDVDFTVKGMEGFPVPVLDLQPATASPFTEAEVVRRKNPQTVELRWSDGSTKWVGIPMGLVNIGDTLVLQASSQRVVGRTAAASTSLDANEVGVVSVRATLPKGGFIGVDRNGRRGLVVTTQNLQPGVDIPVITAGETSKGPAWYPIGTPLPA